MVSVNVGRARRAKAASGSTGIPGAVQAKFEAASGLSFDDVRVHYNSSRPAQLGAYAYTQGSQVYIGPGQERHLEHELGHVIQQKRGLVKADGYIGGVPVNRDPGLERAADLGASQPVQGFWKRPFGRVVQMMPGEGAGSTTVEDWKNRISELREQAPIPIPQNAKVNIPQKQGYDQITFKWEDDGKKFEVRWHTRTPNAPKEQGNTWVVTRVIPGNSSGDPRKAQILVGTKWIEQSEWDSAIEARRNKSASADQEQMLADGHHPAP